MALEVITASPLNASPEPPLLFVHGAWHGAWCWRNFLPFFAREGYAAHAMNLRGHGGSPSKKSLRWVSISDYVDDIAEAAASLPSTPVIIAHSMAGFVMHHYLKRHRVAGAVFLAPVPPRGVWGATWHGARRHPIAFAKVNATLSLWPMVATPARAKDLLFSRSMPDSEAAEYQRMLQDESYFAYVQMLLNVVLKKPATSFPTLVLGADDDTLVGASDMRSTGRFYGCQPQMFPAMAHDMMLEARWGEVAESILRWLRSQPPSALQAQ